MCSNCITHKVEQVMKDVTYRTTAPKQLSDGLGEDVVFSYKYVPCSDIPIKSGIDGDVPSWSLNDNCVKLPVDKERNEDSHRLTSALSWCLVVFTASSLFIATPLLIALWRWALR